MVTNFEKPVSTEIEELNGKIANYVVREQVSFDSAEVASESKLTYEKINAKSGYTLFGIVEVSVSSQYLIPYEWYVNSSTNKLYVSVYNRRNQAVTGRPVVYALYVKS